MTDPTYIQWLLMLAVLCAGASIVLAYISRWEAVVAALASMIAGSLSGYVCLPWMPTLVFWICAALLTLGIHWLLPEEINRSGAGIRFLATGALVGMLLGVAMGRPAAVIIGAALGVLFGAVAFGNMRAGKTLGFPTRKFFNYILAKGLPLVVTFSMLGVFFAQCLQRA